MTETISEFAPRRREPNLQEIEAEIAQHRQAIEQSTHQSDLRQGGTRDVLDTIAQLVALLPLRVAMEMADAIVTLPDYKPPTTKIELAMLLNDWAEKRIAGVSAENP